MSDNGHFLARWSQRKRQVADEVRKGGEPATDPAPDLAPHPVEEPLDLSLLPDIESLTPTSDMTLFLQKGVPDGLRNAALRRMWAIDPAIRDYVGDALDYAWDWNVPGGVPGNGELGAGFDAAKMVAQIFGDAPDDSNVIENAAAQQLIGGASEPDRSMPCGEDANFSVASRSAEESCSIEHDSPSNAPLSLPPAPPKKRRHGAAAPTASPKSLMS